MCMYILPYLINVFMCATPSAESLAYLMGFWLATAWLKLFQWDGCVIMAVVGRLLDTWAADNCLSVEMHLLGLILGLGEGPGHLFWHLVWHMLSELLQQACSSWNRYSINLSAAFSIIDV